MGDEHRGKTTSMEIMHPSNLDIYSLRFLFSISAFSSIFPLFFLTHLRSSRYYISFPCLLCFCLSMSALLNENFFFSIFFSVLFSLFLSLFLLTESTSILCGGSAAFVKTTIASAESSRAQVNIEVKNCVIITYSTISIWSLGQHCSNEVKPKIIPFIRNVYIPPPLPNRLNVGNLACVSA